MIKWRTKIFALYFISVISKRRLHEFRYDKVQNKNFRVTSCRTIHNFALILHIMRDSSIDLRSKSSMYQYTRCSNIQEN